MPPAPKRAFLIDGTSCCYRAFYAIRHLSTSDGRPTNAVYGFVMILQALRQKEHPDYLAVAFDVGKPTFRHLAYEAYKIQRKPMPDPLIAQLPAAKRMLAAYRIPVFEREGFEAEDVLATIAKRIAGPSCDVYLVTGDKDALQLVNTHIKVYNPHKDDAVLDAAAVKARYGVAPEQMVDLMALMGDDIDNIPGVPGVGEKTAIQLMQRFGSLEQLYQQLEEVDSPSRRHALAQHRDQAYLARDLATIDADVPIDWSPEDLAIHEPDWRALRGIFRELEFKKLLETLDAQAPASPGEAPPVRVVADAEGATACLARLAQAPAVAIGCWGLAATTGPTLIGEASAERILVVAAASPDEAWAVWFDAAHLASPHSQQLARWLADPTAAKVAHDAKRAIRLLRRLRIECAGVRGDPMIAAHLLNPSRTTQTVSDLSDEYLSHPLRPPPPLSESFQPTDPQALGPFAQSVAAVARLQAQLAEQLEQAGLSSLYTEVELPLIDVLADMEAIGVAIDLPYLNGLQTRMRAELERITRDVFRLAGGEFNLNSPKQLAHILFERLKLPVIKRTKTGPSTDADVLRQLADRHPLPRHLLEYRELSKLVSTYVEALPQLVDPVTGRLHTTFNQTATATGRLSSSDPNLQNIPIKTDLGRSIRKAFIPGIANGVLLAADYSQIELRILAHLCRDEQLLQAFRDGHDIHRFTASLIYGLPEAEVQPEQRNAMKAVNYGILYGMTAHGLSKELGLPVDEAQAFIDAYFQRYPSVRGYLDGQIEQARREGFVQTLLGRRRYIPEVNSRDLMLRQLGERMAVNAPIQGTAADLIKRAMIQIADELKRNALSSRMILQVHDELVFECPHGEVATLAPLVRTVMAGAITLSVPLEVTLKTGPNWLDLSSLA